MSTPELRITKPDRVLWPMGGLTKRWMLGSVSTKVLHHAPCDVLVVR